MTGHSNALQVAVHPNDILAAPSLKLKLAGHLPAPLDIAIRQLHKMMFLTRSYACVHDGCRCKFISSMLLNLPQMRCKVLAEHEGQSLLLGNAARLARSLADGLVNCPVTGLAVPAAVPGHLALTYLHVPQAH